MSKRKTTGIVTIGLVIAGIVAIVGIGIARANAQTTHFGGADTNGTDLGLLGGHDVGTPADGSYVGTSFHSTDDGGQPAVYGGKGLDTGSGDVTGFHTLGGMTLGSRGGVHDQGGYAVGVRFGSGGRGVHFSGGDFVVGTWGDGFGQETGQGESGTALHTGAGGLGA